MSFLIHPSQKHDVLLKDQKKFSAGNTQMGLIRLQELQKLHACSVIKCK